MQHTRRSAGLDLFHRSKHPSTVVSSSSNVEKYRLWVARGLASFNTSSIGASCGTYGGRNSSVRTLGTCAAAAPTRRHAWWYRALSSTTTMRVPCERCRNNFLRNASKVSASNFEHIERANFPVCRLTAPKQATDLRVDAWMSEAPQSHTMAYQTSARRRSRASQQLHCGSMNDCKRNCGSSEL